MGNRILIKITPEIGNKPYIKKSQVRENDEKTSNELNELMIKLFYSLEVDGFEIIQDKERQVSGIDVIILYKGRYINVDEKGGSDHRNLPTFILELSTFDKKLEKVVDGWFLKEDSKTDAYLLIWIDYDGIEIALVEKEKIIEYLNGLNLTHDVLKEKAKKIRECVNANGGWFSTSITENDKHCLCVNGQPRIFMGDYKENGYQFIRAKNKDEQGICIKLAREKYKEMALFTKKYFSKDYPEVAEYIKNHPVPQRNRKPQY